MDLAKIIRDVPDFPKKGIIFKDITTLLKDKNAFKEMIDLFTLRYKGQEIVSVIGVESRGFILGAPLAYNIGAGFVPVRKPKKLPAETISESYELEYGTDSIEIHKDAIAKGDKVLIIDDLLATGGTLGATCKLVEKLGGDIVEVATLIELTFLDGRKKLDKYKYHTILQF